MAHNGYNYNSYGDGAHSSHSPLDKIVNGFHEEYNGSESPNSYSGYRPARPLTKQVNQLAYELPQNKYAKNPWSYAPEFLKVFSDMRIGEGSRVVFDCVLLGSPRPKVCWLFNDEKLYFDDVRIEDTADLCRLTVPRVTPQHYGVYTVLAENEVGRAVTSATLLPIPYRQ